MEFVGSPGVSALIGALIGAAASIVTTWIGNRREDGRAEQRRRDEREQRLHSFETETYLELQSSLQCAVRLTMEACLQIMKQCDGGRDERDIRIDDGLDVKLLASRQELIRLEQRVMNENLRCQLTRLRKLMSELTVSSQASFSMWDSMKLLSDEYEKASVVIGTRLRESVRGREE